MTDEACELNHYNQPPENPNLEDSYTTSEIPQNAATKYE